MVNRRGRIFYAQVTIRPSDGMVGIEPLDRRITYRSAKAGEIIDHWVHDRGDPQEGPGRDQLALDFDT